MPHARRIVPADSLAFPPLSEWIERAVDDARQAAREPAAAALTGLPAERRALFALARRTKGHPDFLDATAEQVHDMIMDSPAKGLAALRDLLLARVGSPEVLLEMWVDCFESVACPLGTETISLALRQADANPLSLCEYLEHPRPLLVRFASALGWLQAFGAVDPICCPRERWGAALGVTPRAVTDLVRNLLRLDLLREVEGGRYERGHAIEYRFNCLDFDNLVAVVPEDVRDAVAAAYEKLPRFQEREFEGPRARRRLLKAAEWRERTKRRPTP